MKESGFDAFLSNSTRSTGPTAQSRTKESLFFDMVDKYLWDLNNNPYGKPGELHCSSVCYAECSRALFYELMGEPGLFEEAWIEPAIRKVMDNGTGIHIRWQRYLADIKELQLLGIWKCRECGARTSPGEEIPMPEKGCPACKSSRWKYDEFRLSDPVLNLVGKRDGKIILGGKKYLLEIKSMRAEMFRNLTKPVEGHVKQIALYLRMDPEEVRDAMFLYECKNDQKVKVFFYHYDENNIADVLGMLRRAAEGVKTKTAPIRLPGFPRSPACRKCIFRTACKEGAIT